MTDLVTLKGQLARAETNITEGEERITRQVLRIEQLRDAGRDSHRSQTLLRQMEQSLAAWKEHRTEIVRGIRRLEAAQRP